MNYEIYNNDMVLIGFLPLDIIIEIHGNPQFICKPRNGKKPFVIVN